MARSRVSSSGRETLRSRLLLFALPPALLALALVLAVQLVPTVHQQASSLLSREAGLVVLVIGLILVALSSFFVARHLAAGDRLRDRAEIELLSSELRHRMLLETLNIGLFEVDASNRVTYVNPRFCELAGQAASRLLGRDASEIFEDVQVDGSPPRLGERVPIALEEREIRLVRSSGEVIWIHLQGAPMADRLGHPTGGMGICSEITAAKHAEATRTRLQEQLKTVATEWQLTFDAVESPILLLDVDARVRRLNRAAMELSGRGYAENLGQAVGSLGNGEPWSTMGEIVFTLNEDEPSFSTQVESADRESAWDIAASLVDSPSRSPTVIVIARDISDMVALQKSLRRSEVLSVMGSLVAGVAHEVRNPLFGISATLDALENRMGDREDFKRFGQVLRRELQRMQALMQALLDYGKPAELKAAADRLFEVIHEARRNCLPLAEHEEVEISVQVDEDLPLLHMDRAKMLQVFKNLLENAIQHSRPGTAVTVEAWADEARVTCRVRDTGPGFTQAELDRVFDPFYSRRRGGTGLGLSIVQRIVDEHGGTVTARNRPEGGAEVEVVLPIQPAGNAALSSHTL